MQWQKHSETLGLARGNRATLMWGGAALGCYAVHGGFHVLDGRPEDLLWACHIGAVFVGIGLLVSTALICGIGTLFLCLGTPLWFAYLAGGGEFHPTSCLTHLGGLAIRLYGACRLGHHLMGLTNGLFAGLVIVYFVKRQFAPKAE